MKPNDSVTTLSELRKMIQTFQSALGWHPTAKNHAISICLEAAELLEHFQWDDSEQHSSREEIEKELADILIYCLEFSDAYDIDLTSAIKRKIRANARKYPSKLFGKSAKANNHYYAIKRRYRTQNG